MSAATTPPRTWPAELQGAAVVLLGSFNPAIFQPSWFAAKGLLREQETEAASELMVTPEITTFVTDWLQLQVTHDRFQASTSDPAQVSALRDLVIGTFGLLEHTPFNKLGLNQLAHYRMPSEEAWHAFGDYLAPKAAWNEFFTGQVGMRSLTIQAGRAGSAAKYVLIKVEPSVKVTPGVHFEVNEHYEVEDTPRASKELLDTLKQSWEDLQRYSAELQQKLLNQRY